MGNGGTGTLLAVPVPVGLGVRELSVAPHTVPRVKAAVRSLDAAACRAVARDALELDAADDMRKLIPSMTTRSTPGRLLRLIATHHP